MNKIIWITVIGVGLIVAAMFWYTSGTAVAPTDTSQSVDTSTFGTYAYECDEHVTFTMTPSSDMSTIVIAPSVAGAVYPPTVTLAKQSSTSGVRYEGGGVLFTARGETVTLNEGDSAINCSPVPSQDMAPFNFGD